jgi:type IV pilus assembly protein PilN
MTLINLLPWREQKREQEKKSFAIMLGACVIVAGFIVFLINWFASDLVSNQIKRNQILQEEINAYNRQLLEIKNLEKTRNMLISRMSIVQNLQSTRPLMVHLFDELIKVIPSGIYLIQIEGKNNITLIGYAESNTFVSQGMKNIENNSWIHNPVLSEIKKMEDKKQAADNAFKLTFALGTQNKVAGLYGH